MGLISTDIWGKKGHNRALEVSNVIAQKGMCSHDPLLLQLFG